MLLMRAMALVVWVACHLCTSEAARLRLKGHKFDDHAGVGQFNSGRVGKGANSIQEGLNPTGQFSGMFRIRQKSTGRYLDSLDPGSSALDPVKLITQPEKLAPLPGGFDRAQLWLFTFGKLDAYDIMQYSSGFFVEACPHDFGTMLKLPNLNETDLNQKWIIQGIHGGEDNEVQISQISTDRVLDAHDNPQADYQAISSGHLDPMDSAFDRQVWVLEPFEGLPPVVLSGIFSMSQMSSHRVISAGSKKMKGRDSWPFFTENIRLGDFRQMMVIRPVKGAVVTIAQSHSGKLMGAHPLPPDPALNYTVVGQPWMNDMGEELWLVIRIAMAEFVVKHVATGRILDAELPRGMKGYPNLYSTRPTLAGLAGNVSSETWKISKLLAMPLFSGIFKITQRASGYALTATGSGTTLALQPWTGHETQRWEVKRISGDLYFVKRFGMSIALSADEEADPDHKCHLTTEDQHDPAQQLYIVRDQDTGAFFLSPQHNNRWIMARNNSQGIYVVETGTPAVFDKSYWFDFEKVGDAPCVPLLTQCSALFDCGEQDDGCGGRLHCGHHNGTCVGENAITHEKYHCNADRHCHCTPFTECGANTTECSTQPDGCGGSVVCGGPQCAKEVTTIAPVAIPTAAPVSTTVSNDWQTPSFAKPAVWGNLSSEQNRNCKTACDPSFQCGVELDGCGSLLLCGNASGMCEGGSSFTCTKDRQCVCVPKTYCDVGMECGFIDDGCGGILYCGDGEKGACSQGLNFTCTKQNTCSCTPKLQCDPGIECGVQPDGCGGHIPCGNLSGSCITGPNLNFTCSTSQQCTCTPKTKCDDRFACGSQPDGCGGEISCGFMDGACAMFNGNNFTCVDNACECVPRNCNNACGYIEDGCGGQKQCGCMMANQMCNAEEEEIGTCIQVPQPPPPPGIFGAAPGAAANATVVANATSATDAKPTAAVNDTRNASASPDSASHQTASAPNQEVMRYYLFFYYFYYYLEYFKLTNAGMSEAEASAQAGAVANDRALALNVEVGRPKNKALDPVDFMNLIVSRLLEYYSPGVPLGRVFEMVSASVAENNLGDNSAFKVVKDMLMQAAAKVKQGDNLTKVQPASFQFLTKSTP